MADEKPTDRGDKKESDVYDTHEATSAAYAALGVGFVCVLIGLPLWWKTTEIYRVSLPYDDIANLCPKPLAYSPDIKIVICDSNVANYEIALFGETLKEAWDAVKTKGIDITYTGNIRFANEDEIEAIKNSTSLAKLDQTFQTMKSVEEQESYSYYVLPKENAFLKNSVLIGTQRNVFLKLAKDLVKLVPVIMNTTREILVNENNLMKTYSRLSHQETTTTDKDSMRSFHSHAAYDVTFTLINPDPLSISSSWEIEEGVDTYLKPLTDQLKPFAEIGIKSEMLFYISFSGQSRKDDTGFYLRQEDLPHLINPIEGKLSSHVSNNPAIHFITYIPPENSSPLQILGSSTNAFFSPRWGGMFIYNPESRGGSDKPGNINVNLKSVMEVFIPQLQMLLGLKVQNVEDVMSTGDSSLPVWQVDAWLRDRTIENIATAASSLKSLAQLLEKIGNIVIKDDIGLQVVKSVQCIADSERHLKAGQLTKAYHSSQCAIAASETAFFDPSLLELLYFPEDQKFAIYIPLFLPISVPVLMSIRQAYLYLKGKKADKTV